MRIALVTTSYPRSEGDPSGHFVAAHARALAREGHEVHVIAPAGASDDRVRIHAAGGAEAFGWPGVAARLRARPWRALELLRFGRGVQRALARLAPLERVVAHWLVPCAWPLARAVVAPLMAWAHGGDVRLLLALPRTMRVAVIDALLARDTELCFAASALRRDLAASLPTALARRLERHSRIEPPPIDIPPIDEARRRAVRAELGADRPLVVFAARLVRDKGGESAVRAMAGLRHPAQLLVLGDGPERATLETLARRLGIRAHFIGLRARDEALRTIAAADVLLHPSRVEAAPTVIREARALGVPVVAAASGDVAAWAARDPGIFLVPSAEPSALASALARALSPSA